ncbi:hypothetical protein [Gaetbulibacter aestuarii]|uniref:Uncharacterized protein n=1 Tax=Gaetbulibacter aestuarii TaxID=1502358 RepID=A0ABW7N276_9FLAO
MYIKNKPIRLLKDIERIFSYIRTEVANNNRLVRITHDENYKLIIEDLDIQSDFSFTIELPRLDKGLVIYQVEFKPQNTNVLNHYSGEFSSKGNQVLQVFKNWLNTLSEYQTVNIHPSSKVLKDYQEQFYESFEFIDEETDASPLEFKIQRQLSEFLKLLIEEYKEDENVDEVLLNDICELNKLIPQLTQRQLKTQISWIFARLQIKGINAINRIIKVSTDAGIQYIFVEGLRRLLLG